MKRISLLLALICFLGSCSKSDDSYPVTPAGKTDTLSAGWAMYASPASSGGITDIKFTDPLHGYATGATGIYKSNDGGNTWTTLSTATNYFSIGANSSNACFLNGSNTIISTPDRINTATSVYSSSAGFSDCFYTNSTVCYAATPNAVWKSSDGGAFFGLQYSFPSSFTGTPAIMFTDELEGFLARGTALYSTYNGGSSWNLTTITDSPIKSVLDKNGGQLFYTTATSLYLSNNGGGSWSQVFQYPYSENADVEFISSALMYLSAGTSIFKSVDGGNTWSKVVALGPGKSIAAVSFSDEGHGWACGNFGILRFRN